MPAPSPAPATGNRHGSEAFAWTVTSTRIVRLRTQTGQESVVRARIRLPDGRLGRAQTISRGRGIVRSPQIGVDESGNATAVWTQAGLHFSIMAAFRPHGKTFGAPVELGRSRHFVDARPALAVGRFGDAVVAWNEGRSVRVVRRGPSRCLPQRARACFSVPISLAPGADQAVAIGPLGSAYVVWAAMVRTGDDVHTRLRMAVLRRGGRSLGSEHFLSDAGDASQPALAVQPDGSAAVAWRASLPAGGEQDNPAPIMAVTSSPAAVLAPPQSVSTAPGRLPQLRVNGQGEAVMAWNQVDPTPGNPDGPQVAIAIRPAGGAAFGRPALLSPPGVEATGASLAVDAPGNAYLLYGAGGQVAVTQVRPPGSVFGPPSTLPSAFAGGSLLAAGARITAISAFAARTSVSDWTP
ncbi:MAG TPA: hypothetical protein VL120_13230 [Solirubrobacteraceae bacterium]|nr:hypothetical protein [Solirubrobacteraceae bacterium]